MLYYELKKIWVRPGTKIAMLILAGMLAVTCYFAIHGVYYVDENGDNEYGIEAIRRLHLQEWLEEEEQQFRFSEQERVFFIRRYEILEDQAPFYYDYADGWKQFCGCG